MPKVKKEKHWCRSETPSIQGPAVTLCYENEKGELWITNDEYSSQVNFCPVCGLKCDVKTEERRRVENAQSKKIPRRRSDRN